MTDEDFGISIELIDMDPVANNFGLVVEVTTLQWSVAKVPLHGTKLANLA